MICLVTISRSSSERCARLSMRAVRAPGDGCSLTLGSLSVLARSRCSAPASLASAREEAALDTSSAANTAHITRTFPDMSEHKRETQLSYIRAKWNVLKAEQEDLPDGCVKAVWAESSRIRGCLMFVVHGEQVLWLLYTRSLAGAIWPKIKDT